MSVNSTTQDSENKITKSTFHGNNTHGNNTHGNNTHGNNNGKDPMTLKKIIPRDLRPFLPFLGQDVCAYFKLPNSQNHTTKRGINPDGRLLDGHFDIQIHNEDALGEPPKGKVEFVGLGIPLNHVWKWYLQNKKDESDTPAWLKTNACVKPTYSDDQDTRKSQMKAFEKVKIEHCVLLTKKNSQLFFGKV